MDSSDDDDFRKELEGTLPFGRGVRVLAADAVGVFALEKPAGTMTHPNAAGTAKKSLFAADYSLRDECYSCRVPGGKIRKVFVLNRLDSPTSGVVLAATDERVASAVRRAFREDGVSKVYAAVVRGRVAPGQELWRDFLRRVRSRDGALRVETARANSRDALFAETLRSVVRAGTLALGGGAPVAGTLLRLEPRTGRTHQLRVQCASRGIPIFGDKTYGDFRLNARAADAAFPGVRDRLFLHSESTEIAFPLRGKIVRFRAESPLPQEFGALLP